MGAYFYDGNNDGIYSPVDLNQNGIWDPNEDRPDIIGDETLWCVYNDRTSRLYRRFNDVDPQRIEIRQTVFATNQTQSFSNTIFIRYSIVNKGTVAQIFDSVYFSVWTDPDLEYYFDDLVGCDTLLRSGFTYNVGIDSIYGNNPPAFFTTMLQGPMKYNGNQNDTAYNFRGRILGIQRFIGYK